MVAAAKKQKKDEVNLGSEETVFTNPDAALEPGSDAQMRVIEQNDIEGTGGDESEDDPIADEARERLKSALRAQEECFWDNARDMAYLSNKSSYKHWGYKTFETFVDQEFSLAKRKAQFLVQVYNYFEGTLTEKLLSKPGAQKKLKQVIQEIGWSKGRILAREQIITPDNVDDITAKIQTLSYREMQDFCDLERKKLKGEAAESATEDNIVKLVSANYKMTLSQKQDCDDADNIAMTMIGKETTRSAAHAYACKAFKVQHTFSLGKGSDEILVEQLSTLESLSGKSILVFDDETGKIIYGASVVDKLAAAAGVDDDADEGLDPDHGSDLDESDLPAEHAEGLSEDAE